MRKVYSLAVLVVLCCLVVSQYKTNKILLHNNAPIQIELTLVNPDVKKTPDYEYLQDISVVVSTDHGLGTGVLFTREVAGEQKVFVWTAGHVVASLERDDGTFKNATVSAEIRSNGKFVKKVKAEVKVIAYSDPYSGDDLALLEIIDLTGFVATESAVFADDKIQPVGTEIVHVGSTVGLEDSVSLGIVSQTDRELGGKMYDQTSCMAYPGSSGGGVYTTDGKCVGLVTLGVGPGLNFYVPVRRMRAWAKQEGIEWAMDREVPVPLSRTPTSLEKLPREPEIIISLPPSPMSD